MILLLYVIIIDAPQYNRQAVKGNHGLFTLKQFEQTEKKPDVDESDEVVDDAFDRIDPLSSVFFLLRFMYR